ncbi:hypothetical protein BKA69DRAFT_774016 [Paraphysoderma sedebokerense]|nr:hypothetical protein BKA69DRAFT_774016 [Paraphysoderma sedebokerense]
MSTAVSTITMERLAMSSVFCGLGIALSIRIFASPHFYALRKNKLVFTSLTLGTLACAISYFFNLHRFIYPQAIFSTSVAQYILVIIYGYALFAILIERTVPLFVFVYQKLSPTMLAFVRFGVPLILDIPNIAILMLVLFDGNSLGLANNQAAAITMAFLSSFFSVFSNAALSFIFIHTLAKGRKQNLHAFIRQKESINLIISFIISWGYLIVKIVGSIMPPPQPPLFLSFHNSFFQLVVLNSFYDYVYVTKKVSKEILSNKFGGTVQPPATFKKTADPQITATTVLIAT